MSHDYCTLDKVDEFYNIAFNNALEGAMSKYEFQDGARNILI
ncbi:hypothetical protein [Clostridium kluyveri]|nr:hypothetical protein [Clostridium kluyveri]